MSLRIEELFGYVPGDESQAAKACRDNLNCPFLGEECTKQFRDGTKAGVCSVKPATSDPVICCPNRLYAGEYKVLVDIAETAFGENVTLIKPGDEMVEGTQSVVAFGKRWGGELRLPARRRGGGYFVDWVLARLDDEGNLAEFVAVEVQTIDTTGTYRDQYDVLMSGEAFDGGSKAGLNWENVNKRILPQLIYKGHVLRREPLCRKGLFFVCPTEVSRRIIDRLGGDLLQYELQPGSITFCAYDLGDTPEHGNSIPINLTNSFTTTVDQVALAFTAPRNLPPTRAYEQAIRERLE